MKPFKVAVVGAGYFSQFHYDAWTRLPDAAVTAVIDLDKARAAETAARYGIPRHGDDLESILSDTTEGPPDILDIVTAPDTHRAIITAAAGRVPTLICQKPLAPDLAEAAEIVALTEAAGSKLAVHENFRFQPWYRKAKAFLVEGQLGAPHDIAFRLRPGDGQGPEAYLGRQPYFQQMPRFLIHETGIHFVDTFRYLLGEIVAVTARLRRVNPAIAGEDAGYVIFEFANGATGLFDGNRLNDHSAGNCRLTMGEMHLAGSKGVLRLDGDGGLWLKPQGGAEARVDYDWPERGFAGDSVHAQIRHILDHLITGSALANDGRAYLRNMAIVDAIYASNAEGRRIVVE